MTQSPASIEDTLLKQITYTLQGLPSQTLPFLSQHTIILPPEYPTPILHILYQLSEPALLYSRLCSYVDNKINTNDGMVHQALRSALGEVKLDYLTLLSEIEGAIRQPTSVITLKRCIVMTREATLKLRLCVMLIEETQYQKGGMVLSTIYKYATCHGDPFVTGFAQHLMDLINQPFYLQLTSWIYKGDFTDIYEEFFVMIDSSKTSMGTSWEGKVSLNEEMIPAFISIDVARKVLLIGKSLNFLRNACNDAEWVDQHASMKREAISYHDRNATESLEAAIEKVFTITRNRLVTQMKDKFRLKLHLLAYKKYLLLGQGDFVALLMESLEDSLDRPASSLYRHNLTATLETAIRGSLAQHDDSEVLARLDARVLELSHGTLGWDVFTLEYRVDAPLNVIVTSYATRQYLKIFNFLWRLKRVEFTLNAGWRRASVGNRGFLGSLNDIVGKEWHSVRLMIAEMSHFVCQLQYYILFEVIESSWNNLETQMESPDASLDSLIEAHTQYLANITHKGLLGSGRQGKEDSLLAQLHEIMKIMFKFKEVVDELHSWSMTEYTRRKQRAESIESRTAKGEWGITMADEIQENDGQKSKESLQEISDALNEYAAYFRSRVGILLGDLAYGSDVEMRFLAVRLNYNEYYQIRARKGRDKEKDHVGKSAERKKSVGEPIQKRDLDLQE